MSETLAFVVIVVTQVIAGVPTVTEFRSVDPMVCDVAAIEEMVPEAKVFCDYTYAPVTSIRPRMRPDNG